MKMRIQGNSLRFRLTRKEVDLLHRDGRVEAAVGFGPGCVLRYVVEAVPWVSELRARFEDTTISVDLPQTAAEVWANSSQVTIAGGGEDLGILIERDFQCLHNATTSAHGTAERRFPGSIDGRTEGNQLNCCSWTAARGNACTAVGRARPSR
jgi:hypothetical protein